MPTAVDVARVWKWLESKKPGAQVSELRPVAESFFGASRWDSQQGYGEGLIICEFPLIGAKGYSGGNCTGEEALQNAVLVALDAGHGEAPVAVKQVIVMRKDLKMRRGKEVAQGSHASMAFLSKRLDLRLEPRATIWTTLRPMTASFAEQHWLANSFAKVCLQVNSEEELLDVEARARAAALECNLITDSGRTEFNGVPTRTCLAIGPDLSWKIDEITGKLNLY